MATSYKDVAKNPLHSKNHYFKINFSRFQLTFQFQPEKMPHHSCCCEHSYFEQQQHYFPPSSCCRCDLGCNCSNGSVILNSINGFQVTMDLRHYRSNEVIVKTLHDTVIIEGAQKKEDNNDKARLFCVRPKFYRKYKLPRYYDPAKTTATFSSDGILIVTIAAPPPPEMTDNIVAIEDVGPFFETSKPKAVEDKDETPKMSP